MMLTMFDGIKANSTNFNWELREKETIHNNEIISSHTHRETTSAVETVRIAQTVECDGSGWISVYKIAKNFTFYSMHLMELCVFEFMYQTATCV